MDGSPNDWVKTSLKLQLLRSVPGLQGSGNIKSGGPEPGLCILSCNRWVAGSSPRYISLSQCVLGLNYSLTLPTDGGQRIQWRLCVAATEQQTSIFSPSFH
ncbi:hypothetical protein CHARACLAT_022398 [Characodon lateralis]|uniref:Uncharacterized protein n=1 Tax=Characodon lateralis TaxID=208331 RepID=A0ABU7DC40_9TELE|nr:hypothetical protein [Characodon lateralis]